MPHCEKCDYEWKSRVEMPRECPRCKRPDWGVPKGLGPGGWKTVEAWKRAVQEVDNDTFTVRNPSGLGWLFLRRSGGKVTLLEGVPISAMVYGPFASEVAAWRNGYEVVKGTVAGQKLLPWK